MIGSVEGVVRRVCDVPVDFALAAGEDASLAGWRAGGLARRAPRLFRVLWRLCAGEDAGVRAVWGIADLAAGAA